MGASANVDEQGSPLERKTVTWEALAQHSTEKDLWVAISGKVYDLTAWQKEHPGGALPLLAVAGGDATDVFRAMHPPQVWMMLYPYCVGTLETPTPPATLPEFGFGRPSPCITDKEKDMIADYRALYRKIQQDGLTKAQPGFYVRRAVILAGVMSMIVAGVVYSKSTAVHMLCAVALGMWWNQVNFIGHDAGHNAITGNLNADFFIGYIVGNLLTGISMGWWKRSHNVHHVVCNSINYDPDIQHMPVFAISKDFFKKTQYSMYHFRQMTFDAAAQFLVGYQHLTFYPIMAVARINLYIQSLLLFFSKDRMDSRLTEGLTMLGFWVWYSALLMQLPSLGEMVAFFFVSHAFCGILHIQICMSHFSLPTHESRYTAALWAKCQLVGTMDVDCSPQMDWFHGGLQFQIEHHLFPRVPRCNLRAIMPDVKSFCKKHDLPYVSMSFWDANLQTVEMLCDGAMEARTIFASKKGGAASTSFFQSMLWDAMNARG